MATQLDVILAALAIEPMTSSIIADRTGLPVEICRAQLARAHKLGRVQRIKTPRMPAGYKGGVPYVYKANHG